MDLPRTDEEVFPWLGDLVDPDLPHVVGGPAHFALGHHQDPRAVGKIDERQRVGRRRVVGQTAELVIVAFAQDNLTVFRTKGLVVGILPLRHRHDRQRPDVGLAGTLEIHLVVELRHRGIGRIAVGEVVGETQVADPGFDSFLCKHRGRGGKGGDKAEG